VPPALRVGVDLVEAGAYVLGDRERRSGQPIPTFILWTPVRLRAGMRYADAGLG
jgi:hypothetical protein